MKEVIYIMQTKSSILGEWIDTVYKHKTEQEAKLNLMSYRKTALEIGSPSIFRVIKQTRESISL